MVKYICVSFKLLLLTKYLCICVLQSVCPPNPWVIHHGLPHDCSPAGFLFLSTKGFSTTNVTGAWPIKYKNIFPHYHQIYKYISSLSSNKKLEIHTYTFYACSPAGFPQEVFPEQVTSDTEAWLDRIYNRVETGEVCASYLHDPKRPLWLSIALLVEIDDNENGNNNNFWRQVMVSIDRGERSAVQLFCLSAKTCPSSNTRPPDSLSGGGGGGWNRENYKYHHRFSPWI